MIMTVEEVAAYLKITTRVVYTLVKKNGIPGAFKVGGSWRFKKARIDEMFEKG